MASRIVPNRSKAVMKYKILAEFDGMDGRHYVPGELVSLSWPETVILAAVVRKLVVEELVDEPIVEFVNEVKEVEAWQK
jgi:hypothetical protein